MAIRKTISKKVDYLYYDIPGLDNMTEEASDLNVSLQDMRDDLSHKLSTSFIDAIILVDRQGKFINIPDYSGNDYLSVQMMNMLYMIMKEVHFKELSYEYRGSLFDYDPVMLMKMHYPHWTWEIHSNLGLTLMTKIYHGLGIVTSIWDDILPATIFGIKVKYNDYLPDELNGLSPTVLIKLTNRHENRQIALRLHPGVTLGELKIDFEVNKFSILNPIYEED